LFSAITKPSFKGGLKHADQAVRTRSSSIDLDTAPEETTLKLPPSIERENPTIQGVGK